MILEALHLHYLESVRHPCWHMLSSHPASFNEEDGEIALSVLARSIVHSPTKSDIEAVSKRFQLMRLYLDASAAWNKNVGQPTNNQARHLDIPADSDEVKILEEHFHNVIEEMVEHKWRSYKRDKKTYAASRRKKNWRAPNYFLSLGDIKNKIGNIAKKIDVLLFEKNDAGRDVVHILDPDNETSVAEERSPKRPRLADPPGDSVRQVQPGDDDEKALSTESASDEEKEDEEDENEEKEDEEKEDEEDEKEDDEDEDDEEDDGEEEESPFIALVNDQEDVDEFVGDE